MDDTELFAPPEDVASRPEVAVRVARTTALDRPAGVRGRRIAVDVDREDMRRRAPGERVQQVIGHPAHLPGREAAGASRGPGAGVPGRRTVTIRGRGAERDLAFPEPGRPRRPPVRRHERPDFKPDRTARWALMLALVLVLVAATSSHAAALSHTGDARGVSRSVAASPASALRTTSLVIRLQR